MWLNHTISFNLVSSWWRHHKYR